MRSVQDIDDPDMLRQVAVLLERENATLHAKLHALPRNWPAYVATPPSPRNTNWPS